MTEKTIIVVAWHNPHQLSAFQKAWSINTFAPETEVIFVQDTNKEGCARTKNRGVLAAMAKNADIVIVLDDDCFPSENGSQRIDDFAAEHVGLLNTPMLLTQFKPVTIPPSRGTPYNLPTKTPVAAVMGFWNHIGDYDACAQLVRGATTPMVFDVDPVFGQYFPLSGMNLCFRPKEWLPWCQFIDVPRFDDIWMGWLWQREAYRRGFCFRLDGPQVRHSRQSNVFQNLRDEAVHLEANETLWQTIARHPQGDYESLRKLLPV